MRWVSALAQAAVLCIATCAEPPKGGDPRVYITPGLPLAADAPNFTEQAGMLRVVVRVVNNTQADVPVLATTEWFDALGRPVRSTASAPRMLTVPRFGDVMIDSVAPQAAAIQFRVRIERDQANS